MTSSMTAFARVEQDQISWEIRSVNHRYLDVSFRLPEAYRSLEIQLKTILRKRLHRGKIDCTLHVNQEAAQAELLINHSLLASLRTAMQQINQTDEPQASVSALELLRWPGVLSEMSSGSAEIDSIIIETFNAAIDSLLDMRGTEGSELHRIILSQLDALTKIVKVVRQQAPVIAAHQRKKLEAKLEQVSNDIDPARLEQELVYLAQKADVVEELDRLETHIEEVKNTLKKKAGIGRRLDFLMQELNREANTLSSKATAADTSLQAVDLKVIIEQMREQIQNIE